MLQLWHLQQGWYVIVVPVVQLKVGDAGQLHHV
jgi:hypothetical protein